MKKFLCFLLALTLLLSALPLTALAQTEEEDDWAICCWLGDGPDDDPNQLQCVVVYVMRKFAVFQGWRNWLEVVFMDKDGTYIYNSEVLGSKFFNKPGIEEIANNDPNLSTIWPAMKDYLLNRYAYTFYMENLADKTDQEIALNTLQEMFETWVDELVYDTLHEVCYSSMGVVFGIDEVIGTLYSESMDLEGALADMGADGKIADKLKHWFEVLFSILFAIERHRPSGETIANIPLNKIQVDVLEARSNAVKIALHEKVQALTTQHGQFIPRNE